MRINKFIASATGLSRRAADEAIKSGRVKINGQVASLGDNISPKNDITLDNQKLVLQPELTTIMLNKPAGFVVSRAGQGSKTIYDLLPKDYYRLKPIGRLDKDSSGLLLLTDDGQLANELTHPKYQKEKVYLVKLNKSITADDKTQLLTGIKLDDGMSKFLKLNDCSKRTYQVVLAEGKNRQIRRTFSALDYAVQSLHRTVFGPFILPAQLGSGQWQAVQPDHLSA